jgi:hypothetical protein
MGKAHRRGGDPPQLSALGRGLGMQIAQRQVPLGLSIVMLGSSPREFVSASPVSGERIFSVDVLGRTLWGWERRDETGAVLASSEQLFMDYVSCFCDARQRIA